MYFHPEEQDPYKLKDDRADERDDFGGFLITVLFVAMPACVAFFAIGYYLGAWGIL